MLKRDTSAATVIDMLVDTNNHFLGEVRPEERARVLYRFHERLMAAQCFSVTYADASVLIDNMCDNTQEIDVETPFEDIYLEFSGLDEEAEGGGDTDTDRVGIFMCGSTEGKKPSIFMVAHYKDQTTICPAVAAIHCMKPVVEITMPERVPEDVRGFVKDQCRLYTYLTTAVMYAVVNGGVREYVPSVVRRKRKHRKGRKAHRLLEYKVLKLDLSNLRPEVVDGGGSHASPRLHLRRGHWRQYKNGTRRWIKPMWVGDKDRGVIQKEYSVEV